MTLRYRFPVPPGAGSQVYSTYTRVPSPLMSPYSFNTDGVDPFGYPPARGGTIPVPKPAERVDRRVDEVWIGERGRDLFGGGIDTGDGHRLLTWSDRHTRYRPPTSTTSFSPTKKPDIVAGTAPSTRTPTVAAPAPPTAAARVTTPGQ
jgi:hypothetical protein